MPSGWSTTTPPLPDVSIVPGPRDTGPRCPRLAQRRRKRHRDPDRHPLARPPAQLGAIVDRAGPAGLPITTLPPLEELIDGQVSLDDARALAHPRLARSPQIETDLAAIGRYLRGSRVLVTGGAGSIGSETSPPDRRLRPECLVVVDRNESGLYHLHEDLRVRGSAITWSCRRPVQQRLKMRDLFAEPRPQVVFHAAAYKHVPLMESAPDEAVMNNVGGTLIVAEEAAMAGVERFVNISTDKAADPISVMGASKAMAELVVRDIGRRYPEQPTCARSASATCWGAAAAWCPSSGGRSRSAGRSPSPTRTSSRYFMSISEAVQLVLQAASMAGDCDPRGCVFILNMGDPVKIIDVARKMISFAKDGQTAPVEIVFTGMRPGERMHELLVGSPGTVGAHRSPAHRCVGARSRPR